ncbi:MULTISPECIES: diguanylate cyclase [unclassified Thauera]|uniref:diguanylate cyclase domain-containing protein n=1 Tax=unclassified Thauera TaxID=2609274 RepID=UPI0002CED883|nr:MULTISPECIES: diguanylate cyclase [unclassified Thauera]ENO94700.1 diguanylate cyclase [Thauera sp. 28]WBL65621.1 diguanylate cyclase [Thauera sp. WB-2]HAG75247.1 sensor domain-containing diguanylate cyclase [Thauera sp.]HRJ22998.1 diguanylate cyclase [Thauera sp.]HRK09751.1 diguanylate cyclase [Thauera sp.]
MPTRLLQSISLRLVLIVPYVLLLVGLAVALGVLSYSAGSRALSTVSGQLLLETVGRITQAVDRHVVGSSAVLESAFPEGMPAPPTIEQDFHDIRNRFWVATSIHTDPNDYVYYGNEAGQGLGLYRRSSEEVELRMKLRADEHRAIYRYQGVDGHLEFVRRETTLFDPRTRPWYANGKTTDGHTWTSVYIDFGTLQLVATRARRVLGPDNEFAGVVATDVALKALNDFVGRLKVSPNGIAFIVEPDGNLIASSASANVVVLPDGSYGRLQAAESDHPLLKASYLTVRDRIAVVSDEKLPRVFEFVDPEGNQIHAAIDRVRDAAGLDWVTVVAMPASDFLGDVIENVRRTVVLATIAVMVAVAIGLGILSWVSRDLRSLAAVASRIGDGDLETPVGIVRRDEIGELARSFERMQDRLRTDRLTGLANREALLQQLQRRIEHARNDRRNPHVGVLFIDLNRFKSINDNHGHEIGDQVLQEIANRLAHSVRAEDLVARYAGDEFVIVTDNVTDRPALDQVRLHVEAVLRAPLTTPQIAGLGLSVGGAIGGALYPDDGDSPESLLRHADHAMYADKLDRRRSEPSGVVRFPQRP